MFLLLLGIGLIAGILAGLFGIGGGILFTPALFFVFQSEGVSNPVLWTIASSLFCTFVSAFSSSVRQRQQHNFYWTTGLKIGVFGAIGTYVGKKITTSGLYNEKEFAVFFSVILLFAAYSFIKRGRNKGVDAKMHSEDFITPKRSGIIGGIGGCIASLAGIGGGTAMVPLMNLYYRLPIQKAISISSLAIVVISLSGCGQLALISPESAGLTGYSLGYVDFGAALPLIIGGLVGGFGGAWMNLKLRQRMLQWGFAFLALGVAVKLLTDVF